MHVTSTLPSVVYKQMHAQKFGCSTFPNGVACLYNNEVGGTQDPTVLARSNFENDVRALFHVQGIAPGAFQWYVDGVFHLSDVIQTPFRNPLPNSWQARYNQTNGIARSFQEMVFGIVAGNFASTNYYPLQKFGLSPIAIHVQCAFLLYNFKNCFHENQFHTSFHIPSPDITVYVAGAPYHWSPYAV